MARVSYAGVKLVSPDACYCPTIMGGNDVQVGIFFGCVLEHIAFLEVLGEYIACFPKIFVLLIYSLLIFVWMSDCRAAYDFRFINISTKYVILVELMKRWPTHVLFKM